MITPNPLLGTTLIFPTWQHADAHVDNLNDRSALKGVTPVITRLKNGEYELQFIALVEKGKKRRK